MKGSCECLAPRKQFLQKVTCWPASARVGDHARPNDLVAVALSACRAALVILLSMASILVCSDDVLVPVGVSHRA